MRARSPSEHVTNARSARSAAPTSASSSRARRSSASSTSRIVPAIPGLHDVDGALVGVEAPPERGVDEADLAVQLRQRVAADLAAEDARDAAARPHPRRDHAQQRRLAGAVRAEHDPALAARRPSSRPRGGCPCGRATSTARRSPVPGRRLPRRRSLPPVDAWSAPERRAIMDGRVARGVEVSWSDSKEPLWQGVPERVRAEPAPAEAADEPAAPRRWPRVLAVVARAWRWPAGPRGRRTRCARTSSGRSRGRSSRRRLQAQTRKLDAIVAARTRTLNDRVDQLNVLGTKLADAQAALTRSEGDVSSLEVRQRQLADEKAQLEDQARLLASVARTYQTCKEDLVEPARRRRQPLRRIRQLQRRLDLMRDRRRPAPGLPARVLSRGAVAAAAVAIACMAAGCAGLAAKPSKEASAPPPPVHKVNRQVILAASRPVPTLISQSLRRRAERLVVRVRNINCLGIETGSGFALDAHTLLTNRHVLAGADRVEVSTWDGHLLRASTAKVGALVDLGIASVSGRAAERGHGRSRSLTAGERIAVVGFPLGGPLTFSSGRILDFVDGWLAPGEGDADHGARRVRQLGQPGARRRRQGASGSSTPTRCRPASGSRSRSTRCAASSRRAATSRCRPAAPSSAPNFTAARPSLGEEALPGRRPPPTFHDTRRGSPRRALPRADDRRRFPIARAGTLRGSPPSCHGTSNQGVAMQLNSLKDVFVGQIEDLYSAEQQLLKALPQMAGAATRPICARRSPTISSRRATTSAGSRRSSPRPASRARPSTARRWRA